MTVMTRGRMRVQSQKAPYSNRSRSDMDHTALRVFLPEAFSCERWAAHVSPLSRYKRGRCLECKLLGPQRTETRLQTPSLDVWAGCGNKPLALVHTPSSVESSNQTSRPAKRIFDFRQW